MKRQKKIAFIIESLDCGGAEKSLVTLLQNLDYTQLQVDLILLNKGGAFDKLVPEKVNIKQIPLNFNAGAITSVWQRARYFLARKLGNRQQHAAQKFWKVFGPAIEKWPETYDVAISYSQGFCTYFVAAKMQAGSKYTWLNTDYVKAGYEPAFDWTYYRNYNKVVTVSEEGEAVFHKAMSGFTPALSTVTIKDISDPVIIQSQSREPVPEAFDPAKINIVTVCRLEPPKGLHLAVEACKRLRDKGYPVHWYLVGEGSERARIAQLVEQHNIGDCFTLLGFRENPYPYMLQADIYVQTSLYEGWGLTLIEATLLQKPVVTTNFPTAYQIIQEEVNGYIVPMQSGEIAEKIGYLIENRNIAEKMSQQHNHFSEQNKIKSLQQFYQLLEEKTQK